MKKLFGLSLALFLTACAGGNYEKTAAQINAERNDARSQVTTASLDQARMQRTNILEEAMLQRQQDYMKTSAQKESASVVTDTIGSFFKNTIGVILK